MASRYAYLPYIGLFFIIGNIYDWIDGRKKYFVVAILFFVFINSFTTFHRVIVWKDSITLFNDVIKKQPDNAFAFNSRGIAKYDMQDFKGAVEDYSKAISLNKKYPGAYYNRAIAFFNVQNFQESLKDYNKAIELNPSSAKSFMGRGIIKMDVLHDFNGAIEDYTEALRINPDFAQAYYNRGLAELRLGKIQEACNDFKKVKQLGYSRADELVEKYCR